MEITNYASMRKSLAISNWIVWTTVLFVLWPKLPVLAAISDLLPAAEVGPFVGRGAAAAVIALVPAALFFAFIIHNRIDRHLLRTRRRIERDVMLPRFYQRLKLSVPTRQDLNRMLDGDIMKRVFYKYASSERPAIDRHAITKALTNWTLYWLGLESLAVLIPGTLVAIVVGANGAAYTFGAASVVIALCMISWYKSAVRNAEIQIDEILDDHQHERQIFEELSKS